MTHASEALDLLVEEDDVRDDSWRWRLHELNLERQKASQLMFEQAKKQIGEAIGESLIVAYQEGWGAGLVGLVAGKIDERVSPTGIGCGTRRGEVCRFRSEYRGV